MIETSQKYFSFSNKVCLFQAYLLNSEQECNYDAPKEDIFTSKFKDYRVCSMISMPVFLFFAKLVLTDVFRPCKICGGCEIGVL